jgi:hypothetical protein
MCGQELSCTLGICTFKSHDKWEVHPNLLCSRNNAFGDDISLNNAAKDVDEHDAYIWVAFEQRECCRHSID